jgi:K+-transporting ATPase KdpF subunit
MISCLDELLLNAYSCLYKILMLSPPILAAILCRLCLYLCMQRREAYGYPVYRHHDCALCCKLAFRETGRASVGRRKGMEVFYWIGGILAAALLVYLLIALLKPEALS